MDLAFFAFFAFFHFHLVYHNRKFCHTRYVINHSDVLACNWNLSNIKQKFGRQSTFSEFPSRASNRQIYRLPNQGTLSVVKYFIKLCLQFHFLRPWLWCFWLGTDVKYEVTHLVTNIKFWNTSFDYMFSLAQHYSRGWNKITSKDDLRLQTATCHS